MQIRLFQPRFPSPEPFWLDPWGAKEPAASPEGVFRIHVYALVPFALGLLSLVLLTAAFLAFSARSALLRDNDLRVRDIYPEGLRAARFDRDLKQRTYAEAIAAQAAQPDAEALEKLRKADRAATTLVARIEGALNRVSPDLVVREDAQSKEADPAKKKEKTEAVAEIAGRFGERAVGTYSLGRTQMAFWLFLVVAGYIYIAMSIGQFFGIMNGEVVALLGISAATGLGAVILNGDAYSERVTRGYFNDVLSIDDTPQLQRIQALAWTLILGAIFIWIAVGEYRFAPFDDTLLLLMGLASGMYLGFKAREPEVVQQSAGGEAGAPAADQGVG